MTREVCGAHLRLFASWAILSASREILPEDTEIDTETPSRPATRRIPTLEFSKACLVVRYNNYLQSFARKYQLLAALPLSFWGPRKKLYSCFVY